MLNLQILPQPFEIHFNLQIQKRVVLRQIFAWIWYLIGFEQSRHHQFKYSEKTATQFYLIEVKLLLIFKCQGRIFITVETNWQFWKILSSKIEIHDIHDVNAGQKNKEAFSSRDTNKMYLCVLNCSPFMFPCYLLSLLFT